MLMPATIPSTPLILPACCTAGCRACSIRTETAKEATVTHQGRAAGAMHNFLLTIRGISLPILLDRGSIRRNGTPWRREKRDLTPLFIPGAITILLLGGTWPPSRFRVITSYLTGRAVSWRQTPG